MKTMRNLYSPFFDSINALFDPFFTASEAYISVPHLWNQGSPLRPGWKEAPDKSAIEAEISLANGSFKNVKATADLSEEKIHLSFSERGQYHGLDWDVDPLKYDLKGFGVTLDGRKLKLRLPYLPVSTKPEPVAIPVTIKE